MGRSYLKKEKQWKNHPEPSNPVNVGKSIITHHMVIVMVCFDKIIQTYVKLGMDYYYFTKVTNINHINYI